MHPTFKLDMIKFELSKAANLVIGNRYPEAMEHLKKAQQMLAEFMEYVRPGIIDLEQPE